jgi:hypothetical protein
MSHLLQAGKNEIGFARGIPQYFPFILAAFNAGLEPRFRRSPACWRSIASNNE